MQVVHVTKAVGMALAQDLTRVIPGEFKGVAFKKGHIVRNEDIPAMLEMGKDHIYIFELGKDDIHENEAARQLANIASGANVTLETPSEGKVNIKAGKRGLLRIDSKLLTRINMMDGVCVSTLHSDTLVECGQLIASAKVIPLALPKTTLDAVRALCQEKDIVRIAPLASRRAGLVITGNEVYYGRIEDKFQSVIKKKLENLDCTLTQTIILPDDANKITEAIKELASNNDIVFVTGGMSVDPDDVTPLAVSQTGAKVIVYGTPVLPGAMFLMAYLKGKPVLGIPACGMFSKNTVLDVVLPKVIVGDKITKKYIASLGHGGLCQACADGCRFPNCSFCK